ncbi:hypothetical protein PR048_031499 [Dryococelus australis]|uniref:Uncharacterized protein n=1 Tax=Dryococelus australis TaxID=614101 RepID=A0ABQ9G5F9_9NEOP|nr:hypothetical protein PR048_031499 [Dryococelus australis]
MIAAADKESQSRRCRRGAVARGQGASSKEGATPLQCRCHYTRRLIDATWSHYLILAMCEEYSSRSWLPSRSAFPVRGCVVARNSSLCIAINIPFTAKIVVYAHSSDVYVLQNKKLLQPMGDVTSIDVVSNLLKQCSSNKCGGSSSGVAKASTLISIRLIRIVGLAKSKYRNRVLFERASQKQSSDTHKPPYDRVKRCQGRKINIKASEPVNIISVVLLNGTLRGSTHFSQFEGIVRLLYLVYGRFVESSAICRLFSQLVSVTVGADHSICPTAVILLVTRTANCHIDLDGSREPMRVIEVSMEQRQNEGAGETGDPRQNPPINGIVWHDSHMRKSVVTRPGIERRAG